MRPNLQTARDGLHGHRATVGISHATLGVHLKLKQAGNYDSITFCARTPPHTYLIRERIPQGNRREQHFDADEKVLVPGGHRTGRGGRTAGVHNGRDYFSLFQDGQPDT